MVSGDHPQLIFRYAAYNMKRYGILRESQNQTAWIGVVRWVFLYYFTALQRRLNVFNGNAALKNTRHYMVSPT